MSAHTPMGLSPSTPTATSPVSMSPCMPHTHPLPISQSTHWNYPAEMGKKSTTQDHPSILAHQDPNCLLYNLNPGHHMKTLPREYNPSYGQECFAESTLRNIDGALSKKRAKGMQPNFEFASLHRAVNVPHKSFVPHSAENKYTIQGHPAMANFAPNLDHIYECIDSESISSNMYDPNRRANMHNLYGANYRSKSTVNDDDLSSSSIYEDKPLLFGNHNSSLTYEHNKPKRIFIPHHYHSNASIYDKAPKDRTIVDNQANVQTSSLWQVAKDSNELPDLLQKSHGANNLLVSYSGENRFLNKVVNPNAKSAFGK